jgi:hypothetical protein
VEWPAKRFPLPDSPFVIGVFGADGVSDLLREAIQNRRIKDREVVIRHLSVKEEIRSCHVLFVSRSERDRLGPVLGEARRESTLTVGESDNFLAKGGVINFLNVNGAVRFQISPAAASRERLKVSSKLLQLAIPADADPATFAGARIKLSEAQRP